MTRHVPDHVGVSIVLPGIVATGFTPMIPVEGDDDPPIGLSAIRMARHTVQAVLDGECFVVAHPPVVELVDERAEELRAAFARQAPRFDGDASLDTRGIVRAMQSSGDD